MDRIQHRPWLFMGFSLTNFFSYYLFIHSLIFLCVSMCVRVCVCVFSMARVCVFAIACMSVY